MRVLITGADGFVGNNLRLRLHERKDVEVRTFNRNNKIVELAQLVDGVDFIFHLAGVNRPQDQAEFTSGNSKLTDVICRVVKDKGCKARLIYASSTQAKINNQYGISKRQAELSLQSLACNKSLQVYIFRLPNIFGKWCKPNYNSAVATFCYNIARGLPVQIHDPNAIITLVYIDDVVDRFLSLFDGGDRVQDDDGFEIVPTQYTLSVGELVSQIMAFHESRESLMTGRVGAGLLRALYATYISYLPPNEFSYDLKRHVDQRGSFAEVFKTPDCGQFSYFTAYPGVTRGSHYHHTKTEKFLVVKGTALFRFRHMMTSEMYELEASSDYPKIIETIPGWTHEITNIGKEEMVVMLWANENFDSTKPDTYEYQV